MTARPWRSGWCALDVPIHQPSHLRCTGSYDALTGPVPCVCECHVTTKETAVLDTPAGLIVTEAEPGSEEWFAARREGITGTDLPKILGLSKYGNALSVWLDKRGELDDEAGEAARWGTILEDPVALEWAARNDAKVEPIGVVRNAERPWIRASLDRRVLVCPDGDGECGLEIKTRSAFKAADWRDGVPDDVLAQATWGLIATGYDHMHVAALIGGQRLQTYRVDRDEKVEAYLLAAAEPVWEAVQAGVPPEAHPDAEGVLLALLDRLYERRAGDRDLDPEAATKWLDQYAAGADLESEGKRLKTQAKTALVQLLDDGDTGLIDDRVAFTYKRPTPSRAMPAAEVRRLATEQPDVFAELQAEDFIQTTNPGPRFELKRTKKEDQ